MGLGINANSAALGAARQTERTTGLINRNLQQLSSALRINRAADDAAGLAIADRFNTLARQFRGEVNNLQSGISAAQTAEGGLSAQQDAVQRIRELAVQASNGTLTDDQRAAINAEAQQLVDQIGDTAESTEFNGQQLLNQDQSVGLGVEGNVSLDLQNSDAAALGIAGIDLSTAAGAASAIESADSALNALSERRASLGAQSNRFESAINQRGESEVNALDAESRIRDLDLARASIDRARNQVLLQGGLAGLIQSNVTPQSALRLLGQ